MKLNAKNKFTYALMFFLTTTAVYATAPTYFEGSAHNSVPYSRTFHEGTFLDFTHNETVLPSFDAPRTEVISIVENIENNSVVINLSSNITSVNHFMIESEHSHVYDHGHRLVLDFINASTNLDRTTTSNLSNISYIRTYDHTAYNLARIVFDLYTLNNYTIHLSEDNSSVIIVFEQNYIHNVYLQPAPNNIDVLSLSGKWAPSVTIYRHSGRYIRIAADGPISEPMGLFWHYVYRDIDFLTHFNFVRQMFFEDGYLILRVNEYVNLRVQHENEYTHIVISAPTFQNITIDRYNNNLFLHIDNLQYTHTHDYLNNRNIFTLNGNFEGHFGEGLIPFFGDYVSFVEILTYGGVTHLILHDSSHISSARLTPAQGGGFAIMSRHPREFYDFIVVIDPGHGGHDPGAVHFSLGEANYVLYISNRVYESINRHPNIRAFMTRKTDVFVPLIDRALIANGVADLFVSLHVNGFYNAAANGTETFYLPREDEFNFPISRNRVAYIFHENLRANLGLSNRGVRQANFSVLRNTVMPSVLLEPGFISNPNDYRVLASQAGRDAYVFSVYSSILQVMGYYLNSR